MKTHEYWAEGFLARIPNLV